MSEDLKMILGSLLFLIAGAFIAYIAPDVRTSLFVLAIFLSIYGFLMIGGTTGLFSELATARREKEYYLKKTDLRALRKIAKRLGIKNASKMPRKVLVKKLAGVLSCREVFELYITYPRKTVNNASNNGVQTFTRKENLVLRRVRKYLEHLAREGMFCREAMQKEVYVHERLKNYLQTMLKNVKVEDRIPGSRIDLVVTDPETGMRIGIEVRVIRESRQVKETIGKALLYMKGVDYLFLVIYDKGPLKSRAQLEDLNTGLEMVKKLYGERLHWFIVSCNGS